MKTNLVNKKSFHGTDSGGSITKSPGGLGGSIMVNSINNGPGIGGGGQDSGSGIKVI